MLERMHQPTKHSTGIREVCSHNLPRHDHVMDHYTQAGKLQVQKLAECYSKSYDCLAALGILRPDTNSFHR